MSVLPILLMGLVLPAEAAPEAHHEGALVSGRAHVGFALEDLRPTSMVGGGVSLETPIARHLAVELTAAKLVGHHVEEVPLEIVLAGTWTVGRLEPYTGLGPALVVVTDHDARTTAVRYGAVGVAGAHVWVADTWGLLLESGVTATAHHGLVPTLEALGGLVVRWR